MSLVTDKVEGRDVGGRYEANLKIPASSKEFGVLRKTKYSKTNIDLTPGSIVVFHQVFETADHLIGVASGQQAGDTPPTKNQAGALPRDVKFRISVSRAFGSIYAQAEPLDASGRHAFMARIKDEDLIPLVSPNWMET